jgi:hypothetical protein
MSLKIYYGSKGLNQEQIRPTQDEAIKVKRVSWWGIKLININNKLVENEMNKVNKSKNLIYYGIKRLNKYNIRPAKEDAIDNNKVSYWGINIIREDEIGSSEQQAVIPPAVIPPVVIPAPVIRRGQQQIRLVQANVIPPAPVIRRGQQQIQIVQANVIPPAPVIRRGQQQIQLVQANVIPPAPVIRRGQQQIQLVNFNILDNLEVQPHPINFNILNDLEVQPIVIPVIEDDDDIKQRLDQGHDKDEDSDIRERFALQHIHPPLPNRPPPIINRPLPAIPVQPILEEKKDDEKQIELIETERERRARVRREARARNIINRGDAEMVERARRSANRRARLGKPFLTENIEKDNNNNGNDE